METKNRTACFEWLRIFASAAVVIMHTAAVGWNQTAWGSDNWTVYAVWDALVRWPVPVFVMITGAIFLPRKTELKTVFSRYIPRMLLIFILWSGLNTLYRFFCGDSAEALLNKFLTGPYHLWYLPFLCGVYLTLPFLQRIAEDDHLTDQLLAVGLVIGSIVPWVAALMSLLLPQYASLFSSAKNHLNFTFFLDLQAALVLGHWLWQREFSPAQRRMIYLAGLLSLALTVGGTLWLSAWAGKAIGIFFEHSAPTSICTAAALFVFARYNLTRLPRLAAELAKCSFGIYLSHALLIDFLVDRQVHALRWNPVWSVPLLAAAVFAACALGTALVRRIPVIGKYLT